MGKEDLFVQPSRFAILRCFGSIFYALKKDVPMPLLAQEIASIATELLENLGKILPTDSNAVRYQPGRCNVSTFPIERKTNTK